jgi:hypothetical protein
MGRILIASIVGAVVVFVWGFLAWDVLGLYKNAVKPVPHEAAVVTGLKASIDQSGALYFPARPTDKHDEEGIRQWSERHQAGPIGMIMYRAKGSDPMAMEMFIRGGAINFVACLLMACLMYASRMRSFILRLAVALIMAAFAVMVSHINSWNRFMFPDNYAAAMAADVMIGWTLGGIFVAAIVKPPLPAA